jgi:hypothetical protein
MKPPFKDLKGRTRRHREKIKALHATGASWGAIARELNTSEGAVRHHAKVLGLAANTGNLGRPAKPKNQKQLCFEFMYPLNGGREQKDD